MDTRSQHARTHAHRDVPISQVLEEGIVEQLLSDMKVHGVQHVDEVEQRWVQDFRQRTIIGIRTSTSATSAR